MAPQYKLMYFNMRGLAEISRLIFAYAGVTYEDVRVERGPEWDELKPKTPFGVMPILEIDDLVIGQSRAIARYLAHQYGLAGKTPLESAKCDMLVDYFHDLVPHLQKWLREQDSEKKAKLLEEFLQITAVNYLDGLQKHLQSNEYFVGDNLTWADLALADSLRLLDDLFATVLDNYPTLVNFRARIFGIPKIKEWTDKAPVTEL